MLTEHLSPCSLKVLRPLWYCPSEDSHRPDSNLSEEILEDFQQDADAFGRRFGPLAFCWLRWPQQ